MNSGEITQEYDQHLGPVNTITFVDNNRRFVTTSDDKTIRAWDFDIPVVIKYIAEPHMHSMPAVTAHPKCKLSIHNYDDGTIVLGQHILTRTPYSEIFRRPISRQPDPHLQLGKLPAKPEEAVRRPLRRRVRLPGRLLSRREVDLVGR
jgi:WD40 repeat protein